MLRQPHTKDYLLTAAERSFYEVVCSVLDGQLLVFAKVRLADLVYMLKGTANQQTHFNRIQSKHVDFVLCTRDKLSPVFVIELDDASHEEEKAEGSTLYNLQPSPLSRAVLWPTADCRLPNARSLRALVRHSFSDGGFAVEFLFLSLDCQLLGY